MAFRWSVEFDTAKNEFGETLPRVVAGGSYRFCLKLYNESGDPPQLLMTIYGFRVDRNLTAIMPPTTTYGSGSRLFQMAQLTPAVMELLLEQLRYQLDGLSSAAPTESVPPPAAPRTQSPRPAPRTRSRD